jgi:hypothetical protein
MSARSGALMLLAVLVVTAATMCLHEQPVVIHITKRHGQEIGHEPVHQRTVW